MALAANGPINLEGEAEGPPKQHNGDANKEEMLTLHPKGDVNMAENMAELIARISSLKRPRMMELERIVQRSVSRKLQELYSLPKRYCDC